MKASELMIKLGSFIEKYGDLDISMDNNIYAPKNKNIDRRTKHIVHLSDGSIKYDFNKYNNYMEAIHADYLDCPTDEQLKESISLCFPDNLDQKIMFKKLKLQFSKAPKEK